MLWAISDFYLCVLSFLLFRYALFSVCLGIIGEMGALLVSEMQGLEFQGAKHQKVKRNRI